MRWPLVTRRAYREQTRELAIHKILANAAASENEQLKAEVEHLKDCFEALKVVEGENRQRRLIAEGKLKYILERAEQARALMLPFLEEP